MRAPLSTVMNTLVGLVLAVALPRYVRPFWGASIVDSLMTHATLAAACLALLAFVLRRQAASLVLVVAALALAGHSIVMKREFAIVPTGETRAAGPSIRVLSFNMLSTNVESATTIADRVIASGADVAVILEGEPMFMQMARLERTYPYRVGCGIGTPTCDLILLSRTPLTKAEVGALSDIRPDRFMSAEVTFSGRRVHVVAAHLSKPYFDSYHRGELEALRALIGNDRGPLVLAGDFNAATIAPDMQAMLRALDLRTVTREPGTWPVALAPFGLGIAIDHIYSRPPLVPLSVERLEAPFGSNHYGLFAQLAFDEG